VLKVKAVTGPHLHPLEFSHYSYILFLQNVF